MVALVINIICTVLLLNQTPATSPPAQDSIPLPDSIPPASDTLLPVERWTYEAAGRRDPFLPLLGVELGPGGKAAHLNPENLRLIGILWGAKGYYALVKDGLDNGYILKPGDRVASGIVSEINRKSVIFDITHAGLTTKYELALKEETERR